MQTIPVNNVTRKAQINAHNLASPRPQVLPVNLRPLPLVPSMPSADLAPIHQQLETNPYAELDAMLIRNPNMGAVHGLRTALLFNAGLLLSGIMVWELWTLLVS